MSIFANHQFTRSGRIRRTLNGMYGRIDDTISDLPADSVRRKATPAPPATSTSMEPTTLRTDPITRPSAELLAA